MIRLYEKRTPIYQACQWDGTNVEEMQQFLGKNAVITERAMDIVNGDFAFGYDLSVKSTRAKTQNRYGIVSEKRLKVGYGDYVIINDMDDKIQICSASDFEKKFRLKENNK